MTTGYTRKSPVLPIYRLVGDLSSVFRSLILPKVTDFCVHSGFPNSSMNISNLQESGANQNNGWTIVCTENSTDQILKMKYCCRIYSICFFTDEVSSPFLVEVFCEVSGVECESRTLFVAGALTDFSTCYALDDQFHFADALNSPLLILSNVQPQIGEWRQPVDHVCSWPGTASCSIDVFSEREPAVRGSCAEL